MKGKIILRVLSIVMIMALVMPGTAVLASSSYVDAQLVGTWHCLDDCENWESWHESPLFMQLYGDGSGYVEMAMYADGGRDYVPSDVTWSADGYGLILDGSCGTWWFGYEIDGGSLILDNADHYVRIAADEAPSEEDSSWVDDSEVKDVYENVTYTFSGRIERGGLWTYELKLDEPVRFSNQYGTVVHESIMFSDYDDPWIENGFFGKRVLIEGDIYGYRDTPNELLFMHFEIVSSANASEDSSVEGKELLDDESQEDSEIIYSEIMAGMLAPNLARRVLETDKGREFSEWATKEGSIRAVEYHLLCVLAYEAAKQGSTQEEKADKFYKYLTRQEKILQSYALPEGHPLTMIDRRGIVSFSYMSGLAGFILQLDPNTAILIINGTEKDLDIMEDIGSYIGGNQLSLQVMDLQSVLKALNKGAFSNVFVTGHSLGGQLAEIASENLSKLPECVAIDPITLPSTHVLELTFNSSVASKIKVIAYDGSGAATGQVSGMPGGRGDSWDWLGKNRSFEYLPAGNVVTLFLNGDEDENKSKMPGGMYIRNHSSVSGLKTLGSLGVKENRDKWIQAIEISDKDYKGAGFYPPWEAEYLKNKYPHSFAGYAPLYAKTIQDVENNSGQYAEDSNYDSLEYTLCDTTGDGVVKELIVKQVSGKHGAHYWVYTSDGETVWLMGEFDGENIDELCGYHSGVMYVDAYKGYCRLILQEWKGYGFEERTLYEGNYDRDGDTPTLESLHRYYDRGQVSEWVNYFSDVNDFTLLQRGGGLD